MTDDAETKNDNGRRLSAVTIAFLENSTFLKRFLARFLFRRQDIEDVAQEAYLRAYIAEQRNDRRVQ